MTVNTSSSCFTSLTYFHKPDDKLRGKFQHECWENTVIEVACLCFSVMSIAKPCKSHTGQSVEKKERKEKTTLLSVIKEKLMVNSSFPWA